MKKNIFTFLGICFMVSVAYAQTPYYKMLGDTNRWFVSGFILGVKSSSQPNLTDIGSPCLDYYKAIHDSVHNSKVYKIFEKNQQFCPYTFDYPEIGNVLIREDSLARKVYMIHPDSVNECVAMDFSMNVGDSIYLPYAPTSYVLKNGYYKLDSIVMKPEIMGPRKHFFLSKFDAPLNFMTNQKYYVEWIESIGATHFPINIVKENENHDFNFPVFSCHSAQYSSYVTCKYTNSLKYYQDSCSLNYALGNPYYHFSGNNCEYWGFSGNTKELSFLQNVELFPNPSLTLTDHLTLKFKALTFKPLRLLIYNDIGQVVYSRFIPITTTDNEIMFKDLILSSGLYTLNLSTDDESTAMKFICE